MTETVSASPATIGVNEVHLPTALHWGLLSWAFLALAAGLLTSIMHEDLAKLLRSWGREEYNYAYMLPVVAAFLFWQKSTCVAQTPVRQTWIGVVVTAAGLLMYVAGELSTVYTLVQYAFLVTLGGVAIGIIGWPAFRIVAPAYLLLFFVVPLPPFLYNNISADLQLLSSQLGVSVMRLLGVSVFLEGNVIDLGGYKLQVAEACSGLRYLFPLMALGYIAAYIFKGAFWKKAVLFSSTIPIAVLMNSVRIGMIGVFVEYGGLTQAEGFLHDFEGWAVFMACAVLLALLMALLAKVGTEPIPLRDAFAIEGPTPLPANLRRQCRRIPLAFYVLLSMLVFAAAASYAVPRKGEVALERTPLLFFPSSIGEWRGRADALDPIYLKKLRLDDYLLADYSSGRDQGVNLWIAYYGSQRKGASVHSPKSCLPGGGWQLQGLSQIDVSGVTISGRPLRVNRALMQMGEERQLLYYWFQQRGRVLTNEYLVKLYVFWDALTRNRTDGALVRLTTSVAGGHDRDLADADELLSDFARVISPRLPRFIPD